MRQPFMYSSFQVQSSSPIEVVNDGHPIPVYVPCSTIKKNYVIIIFFSISPSASGAPLLSKFGNLSSQEILVVT